MKEKVLITGLILISLMTGIKEPNINQTPISTQEEPQIVSHTAYLEAVENITFFTVVVIVQNTLETNIKSVNVTATFYDAMDNPIGTNISPTEVEILKPKQKVPVRIYLRVDSATNITDISYELTLAYTITIEEPIEGVMILHQKSSIDMDGYYRISGELQNKGIRTAYAVKLLCTYYDSGDNVLAVSHAYVAPRLVPMEKVVFEVTSKPHKINPASYELLIAVQRYQLIPISRYPLLFGLIIVITLFVTYMKKRRGW